MDMFSCRMRSSGGKRLVRKSSSAADTTSVSAQEEGVLGRDDPVGMPNKAQQLDLEYEHMRSHFKHFFQDLELDFDETGPWHKLADVELHLLSDNDDDYDGGDRPEVEAA